MSDIGEVSPEQLAAIQQWLQEQFPGGFQCPACHRGAFEIGKLVMCLPYDPMTGKVGWTGGTTTPLVQIRCKQCRYVSLFEVSTD